jgi:hypothetical protein
MNDISAGYAELPRTAYFDNALRRARTAAEQRSHRYVTLEHLLLALLDDPDATGLLRAVGADVAAIHAAIGDAVNHRMSSLTVPDGRAPSFSYKFDVLMLAASEQAVRFGKRQVDGGLALIAIAKDQESNASAILGRNGFNLNTALQHLAVAAGFQDKPREQHTSTSPAPPPRNGAGPAPTPETFYISPDASMDEMLSSVRSILDAEERKDGGLSPSHTLAAPPPVPNAPPRIEPRFDGDFGRDRAPSPHAAPAPEPRLGQRPAPSAPQEPARPSQGPGDARSDLRRHGALAAEEDRPPPSRREPKNQQAAARRGRGRAETPPILALLLEHIPRKLRVAVGETVEVRMTKEDAAALFDGLKTRMRAGSEHAQTSRAITVRLTAPEGGFFIETLTPETQWIFDRPSFLGNEEFGRWIWTLIPAESGRHLIRLVFAARDIDENGLAGDIVAPEQFLEIRVRGNRMRAVGRLFKTVFLLLLGSGLTAGAYYALKIMGKLPH